MADQVERQLGERAAVVFRNQAGGKQGAGGGSGNLPGGGFSGIDGGPVEFDDDLAAVRGIGRGSVEVRGRRREAPAGRGDLDFVAGQLRARESRMAGEAQGHREDPARDVAVEAVGDHRHPAGQGLRDLQGRCGDEGERRTR